jgi:hypothetical protein
MCPLCTLDQDHITSTYAGDGVWLHTCTNPPKHAAAITWQQTVGGHLDDLEYGGYAEEWGIYDDLRACFEPRAPFLEYGIVEYLYKQRNPNRFAFLVQRYKHTDLQRRGPHNKDDYRYTASSFLGSSLGRMTRHGDLLYRAGEATGRWRYNYVGSYWALAVAEPSAELLTWRDFAKEHNLDPDSYDYTEGIPAQA